ncbi:MAG: TonB-dependent receptor [Rhodothermales bacterium]|nr:TonB-dependent receptor [Rhodothermales bacterium]
MKQLDTNHWSRSILLLSLCLATAGFLSPSFAQTTGKIAGVVSDEATGELLPGVNVLLEGTTIGSVTDIEGRYAIIGVPPGTHTVIASFVGFATARVEGVSVNAGLTAEVNFEIREEVFEGEEVVVTAVRPLIQKDVTATTAIVDGERIRSIPVENFSEVVALQAGVVDGHFRGGRLGEVGYWVDGVPVNDVFDGNLGVSVENNVVQEVQVVTGAFNAEYGQAMSGIVNIVTRDGDNQFTGGFSGFTGDYGSTNDRVFNNIDSITPTAVRNLEADLGGPVIKDKVFFFVSGRYFENSGSLYGQRIFTFDDVGFDNTNRLSLLNPSGSGDSSFVAMNPYEKLTGQAKLTWRAFGRMKISVNNVYSREDFTDYSHELRFLPDGLLNKKRTARTTFGKITHTLNASTFYELGVTNTQTNFDEALFDDPADPRYVGLQSFYDGFTEPLLTSNFRIGGTNNKRFDRSTTTNLAKFDLTSQANATNLVKIGLEFRRHNLQFNDQRVVVTDFGPIVVTDGSYEEKPIEMSGYLQDKIEFGDLILNLGLRFDYFDANGRVLRDPTSPFALFLEERLVERVGGCNPLEVTPCNVLTDENGAPVIRTTSDGSIDWTPDEFFKDTKVQTQLSPRVGVSFPITAGGVVHFSYGWFFQIPNFELLYRNPYYTLGSGGSGLIGLLGNPSLEPQKTINGEIGLKQEVTTSSAIEVTAYFRDIRNLAGTATDPIAIGGSGARYGQIANSDFGFIRGIIFRYDQYFGGNFSMNLDYTFQVAKGNSSDPSQAFNAAAAKEPLEQKIVSLNWDQLHTGNVSLTYSANQNWGFGLISTYGTGLPYTPRRTTLQSGGDRPPGKILVNSERKPVSWNVDINLYKNFKFAGSSVQVFSKIDNVFDTKTEFGVYDDTGRATYSLQRNVDEGPFVGDEFFLDSWYSRPDFFREPRRIVLGLSYRF